MSVHSRVPLGGAGSEAPAAQAAAPTDTEAKLRPPHFLYKNGTTPTSADVRIAALSLPVETGGQPTLSVQRVPSENHGAEKSEAHTESGHPEVRAAAIPLTLLAETPISPLLATPSRLVSSTNERELRREPGAPRESTEVHVHIGRIEVIAAQEPGAPKKARTQAPRQTVPLADYLGKKMRP
jgi:hypothetical protein